MVYDSTLKVKFTALTRVLVDLPKRMTKRGIYLAGNSEGAIVLGMMDDDVLDPTSEVRRVSGTGLGSGTFAPSPSSSFRSRRHSSNAGGAPRAPRTSGFKMAKTDKPAKLLGRINIAYSLEPNYFTYRTLKRVRTESANLTEANALFPPPSAAAAAAAAAAGSSKGSPGLGATGQAMGQMGLGMTSQSSTDTLGPSVAAAAVAAAAEERNALEASDSDAGTNDEGSTHGGKLAVHIDLGASDTDTNDGSAHGGKKFGGVVGGGGSGGGGGVGDAATALISAPRGLFGSRWRRDVPTLCINGSDDQFFGRRGSVSEDVVRRSRPSEVRKGDRPHITGDAGQRMSELGMTVAFVAQMEGAKHAMCPTHDVALRALITDFLAAPEQCAGIPDRWDRDDTKDGIMLWHATITPGQCSFASMASTEELLGTGAASGLSRRSAEISPMVQASSFLDLTSGLARRFVRGGMAVSGTATPNSPSPSPSPLHPKMTAAKSGGSTGPTSPPPWHQESSNNPSTSQQRPHPHPHTARVSFESAVRPLVAAVGGGSGGWGATKSHASNPNFSGSGTGTGSDAGKEAPAANGGLFVAAHAVAHHRSSTTEGKAAAAAAEAAAEAKNKEATKENNGDGDDAATTKGTDPSLSSSSSSSSPSPSQDHSRAGKWMDDNNNNNNRQRFFALKQFALMVTRSASSLVSKVSKSSSSSSSSSSSKRHMTLFGGLSKRFSSSPSSSRRSNLSIVDGVGDVNGKSTSDGWAPAPPARANAYRLETGNHNGAGGVSGGGGHHVDGESKSDESVDGSGGGDASSSSSPAVSPPATKKSLSRSSSTRFGWIWKKLRGER